MILAGDVGGTSTRLAIFSVQGTRVTASAMTVFRSRELASLRDAVRQFMAAQDGAVEAACFGVAGPVVGGRAALVNVSWTVDARELATELGLSTVGILNDLEANAYGVGGLEATDFVPLNPGASACDGNAAIISAGTGLGEAGFYWDGSVHRPFACEGGHADFAPRDDEEAALREHLVKRYAHVSYERVLSGPGLHNIYTFLRERAGGDEPGWLTDAIRTLGGPAAIANAGLDGTSETCVKALHRFVSFYGAEAGNLALKLMASAGVYVGGGIAPKILPKLLDGTFMQAFTAKGRMTPLMETIPVRVIRNDTTALIGAARWTLLHTARGAALSDPPRLSGESGAEQSH
jgi:glucokinase